MTKEIFENISSTFIMCYSQNSPLYTGADVYNMALSSIKVLDMKYDYDTSTVTNVLNGWTMSYEEAKKYYNVSRKTPYKLKSLDKDSIETILNSPKYEGLSKKLSMLFECIGYILDYESSLTTMVFVGSPIYDMYPSYNTKPFEKVNWKSNLRHSDGTPIELNNIDWMKIK